jgi:hypothetical protein
MTRIANKIFNRLKKNLRRTSKTAEEALKAAPSWQIALALLVTSTVGTYLLIVAIGPTAVALAQACSKSLPIVSNGRSVILLVTFYVLAWLTYSLLDVSKDFAKELRHRTFGL